MPYNAKHSSGVAERAHRRSTDAAAFRASITEANRTQARMTLSAGEIFEQIDAAEFAALDAAQTARIDRVLSLGAEVIVGPGNSHQAVQEFIAAFGGASATVAALSALRDVKISRAAEIGLPDPSFGDVARKT